MKTLYKIFMVVFLLIAPILTKSQIINTFAGIGVAGYSGDGGQATAAEIKWPSGICSDNKGNVFISGESKSYIRMVNSSGIITTFAGIGVNAYSGDGGPATAAELDYPAITFFDTTKGNLLIADQNNDRIRMVNSSGIISTVAGNGVNAYSGDGGPAIAAELSNPASVILDKTGNMYISDYNNFRVRMVDTSGIISTIAGNGVSGYSGDGGPATAAELHAPASTRIDAAGNIYIAESFNNCIRKIDTSGIITTVAGTGVSGYNGDGIPATTAELSAAFDVFVDASGNLFIVDDFNFRIREVNTSGIISTVAGNGSTGFSGDGGLATLAELSYPQAMFIDASSNMYIADLGNERVRKISGVTTSISTVQTEEQLALYPNPANNIVTIVSSKNIDAIKVFTITGQLLDAYNYENKGSITKQIDVSDYAYGIYLVTILSDNRQTTMKLIVNR